MGDGDEAKVLELLEQSGDEALLKLYIPPLISSSSASSASSFLLDSIGADNSIIHGDLLARFQRLKAPPPTPRYVASSAAAASAVSDHVSAPSPAPWAVSSSNSDASEDPLGSDLAARLAALKTTIFSGNSSDAAKPSAAGLIAPNYPGLANPNSAAFDAGDDVEKLLASVTDLVRLEKKRSEAYGSTLGSHFGEDDEGEDDDEDESISQSEVKLVMDWARDAARLDPEEEEEEQQQQQQGQEEEGRGGGGKGNPKPTL